MHIYFKLTYIFHRKYLVGATAKDQGKPDPKDFG